MKKLVLLALLVLVPTMAFAQAVPTSYDLQIFSPGVSPITGTPIQVSAIPLTAVTCNLAPPPPPVTPVIGVRFLYWDDIAIAGRSCRVDRFTVFLALPLGTGYVTTLTASNAGGTSARSAASNPFNVALLPPVAPTGLVVTP